MLVWGNKAIWASGIQVQLYPAAQGQTGFINVGRIQSSERDLRLSQMSQVPYPIHLGLP